MDSDDLMRGGVSVGDSAGSRKLPAESLLSILARWWDTHRPRHDPWRMR